MQSILGRNEGTEGRNAVWEPGASAEQYLLGGYSVPLVKPGGDLKVRNLKSGADNGRLQALFTLDDVPVSEGVIQAIAAVRSFVPFAYHGVLEGPGPGGGGTKTIWTRW